MGSEFCVGDKVNISDNAVYFTGKLVSPKIKSMTWTITSISGRRAILGKSADGNYNLNAPIDTKYLTKVETSE